MDLAILQSISGSILYASLFWLFALLIIRRANWDAEGNRVSLGPFVSRKLKAQQIEYHNRAIYRAFEFFIKITLALLGGIAFLIIQHEGQDTKHNGSAISALIYMGLCVETLASIVFSFIILSHQQSKIGRWSNRFKWWEVFTWGEYWMVLSMLIIGLNIWQIYDCLTVIALPANASGK